MSRAVATGEWIASRVVDAVIAAEDTGAQRFPAPKTIVVRNAPLVSEFSEAGPPLATRDNVVVYSGEVESVRRLKDDVREVKEGFECGIKLKNYNEIKEGDQLEFFEVKEVARTLS